jgi:hypothetical protein
MRIFHGALNPALSESLTNAKRDIAVLKPMVGTAISKGRVSGAMRRFKKAPQTHEA